ncbi:hypothetical protein GCM10009712_35230 [Pseudarthrobacter sulfonivorans]|uniref:glycosyltransferase n=1 Tax=Pseudarthrobacter sulfonivorans TaxID=121292 RepID=UPI00168BCD20|nr:glycosyltransferase [Pseudarthrobacter sulfonivorans]
MKILVYPHDLKMGGSQLNAIEIAGAIQQRGHEVVVFGRPGPLVEHIDRLGLEFVECPGIRRRPSPAAIRALRRLVRERGIDVVHGYEWPPSLECYLAAHQMPGTAAVSTVMSMAVAPFIPAHMPVAVGTGQIAAAEEAFGRDSVTLLEPPVDVASNRPGLSLDQAGFRERWGLRPEAQIVAVVSRLARQLKLEGILAAIEAVSALSGTQDVQLLIAGDGPAHDEVAACAAETNRVHGRSVVVLTGELQDPRAAYDVADVCLGMGGSALRAMAFAKPLVVQGEEGFWELLTPDSVDQFLWQGWYGVGTDAPAGAAHLTGILAELLPERSLRAELSNFSLSLARDRFTLERAADTQLDIYVRALHKGGNPASTLASDCRAAASFANYESRRMLARWTGRESAEDFNAKPVAAIHSQFVRSAR